MKLNIGDRVVCVVNHPDGNQSIMKGMTGTVVEYAKYSVKFDYGVEWDTKVDNGHSCHHTCKNGYGWMVNEREIELLELDDSLEVPIDLCSLFTE